MSHRLNRSVLSIDVGTSGVRAALFDDEGHQLEDAQAVRRRDVADFAELDPDELVNEVIRVADELKARCVGAHGEIESRGAVAMMLGDCGWNFSRRNSPSREATNEPIMFRISWCQSPREVMM